VDDDEVGIVQRLFSARLPVQVFLFIGPAPGGVEDEVTTAIRITSRLEPQHGPV
jgi:hypothetical protein